MFEKKKPERERETENGMKKYAKKINEGREIKQVSVFLNLNLNMHVHIE